MKKKPLDLINGLEGRRMEWMLGRRKKREKRGEESKKTVESLKCSPKCRCTLYIATLRNDDFLENRIFLKEDL